MRGTNHGCVFCLQSFVVSLANTFFLSADADLQVAERTHYVLMLSSAGIIIVRAEFELFESFPRLEPADTSFIPWTIQMKYFGTDDL